MNYLDNRFMFQFVSSTDGSRSSPFVSSIGEVKSLCSSFTDSEADTTYVLMLAPEPGGTFSDDVASRLVTFPLLYVRTFVEYDFSFLVNLEMSHA